jgi:DNA-binding protein HU-beta
MSITIKEIVEDVVKVTGSTKTQAEQVISAVFDRVSSELKSGNEVTIKNFGRFFTKQKPARNARNPKTGETVQVPEKTVIKFAPRGELKT